ncbi:hypothetical protein ASE38_01430 [Cellulomonas sp. Root930]|nr:hypothetical protein ASE38_01430 [Cellulomonas sp. Root930]
MQLKDLSATLLRRWYLTLGGLLAVGAICIAVFELIPASFETEANVVLLPPESSVGEGGNPYLYLGGLDQATDVLTRALTSDASRTQVLETLGHADYDVLPDWATSGPILIVTGRGTTAEQAEEVRNTVLESVPSTLVVLQKALNVPDDSQITSMVLTSDDEPTAVMKSRMRAVAAAGVASLVGVFMLIGLIDGLLTSRSRGRGRRRVAAAANVRPPALAPDDGTNDVSSWPSRSAARAAAPEPMTGRRVVRDDVDLFPTPPPPPPAQPLRAPAAVARAEVPAVDPPTSVVSPRPSSVDELDALMHLESGQGALSQPRDRR